MAIRPTKPAKVGLSPRPSRLQPDTFPALADAGLTYQATTLPDYTDLMGDFYDDGADYIEVLLAQAEAAVLVGDVEPDTGKALNILRFNAAGAALETINPRLAIPILTPTQAQAVTGPDSAVPGLVTGELLGSAFAAQEQQIGVGQTPQNVSAFRSRNTVYQNLSGKPIPWGISRMSTGGTEGMQVSVDGLTWIQVATARSSSGGAVPGFYIVPDEWYYQCTAFIEGAWTEMRT